MGITDIEKQRIAEIVEILSKAHVQRSVDPETLYYGTFQDYEYKKGGWKDINILQGELYMLCRKEGQEWAR